MLKGFFLKGLWGGFWQALFWGIVLSLLRNIQMLSATPPPIGWLEIAPTAVLGLVVGALHQRIESLRKKPSTAVTHTEQRTEKAGYGCGLFVTCVLFAVLTLNLALLLGRESPATMQMAELFLALLTLIAAYGLLPEKS